MKTDNKPKSEIAQVFSKVISDYQKNKSKKLLMVDSLIVFSLFSAVIQVSDEDWFNTVTNLNLMLRLLCVFQAVYMILVGTFPFNSFLSGFFCHIGLFALAGMRRTTFLACCVVTNAPLCLVAYSVVATSIVVFTGIQECINRTGGGRLHFLRRGVFLHCI